MLIYHKLKANYLHRVKILLYKLLGSQYLNQEIGKVKVPYSSKIYLKRSFSQQGEDLILDRIITRILKWNIKEKRNYVDVGAYHAIEHSVTYLLYLRRWKGIVFDPSRSTLKTFRQLRKRDIFINAVVGNDDLSEVDFYIPTSARTDMASGSTKYPNQEQEINFRKVRFKQVNLNDELKRQNITKIHFLNIDVEGAELEILNTFEFDTFKPSIIAVEIHGYNLEECLNSEEAKLILSKGYIAVGSAVITQFFVRKEELS